MRLDARICRERFRRAGLEASVFSEIDSTNSEAKRLLSAGKPIPCLIAALSQTGGRGRRGNRFFSPRGAGLYLTYTFPKAVFAEPLFVTPAAALAVRESLFSSFGVDCRVKWVNDLYREGKKVCGILCENAGDFVIIGIGVNFLRPSFVPEELNGIYGALGVDPGEATDWVFSLYETLLSFFRKKREEWIDSYRSLVFHLNREVFVIRNGAGIPAFCEGLDDELHLVVRFPEGTEHLSSGEISLKV